MPIINQIVKGGGSSGPKYYIEKTVDANGVLQAGNTLIDFSGVRNIGNSILSSAFDGNSNITGSLDMSDIVELTYTSSCYACFRGTHISSVDLSSLQTISGSSCCINMFVNCSYITSLDLSSLQTINAASCCYQMFGGCRGLTNVDLSSLQTINGTECCYHMFNDCTGITNVDLSNLQTINSNKACQEMFINNTGITSIDLSSLTSINGNSACEGMFRNCSSLTSVNLQSLSSIIGQYPVKEMFSGTNISGVCLPSLTRIESISSRIPPLSQFFVNCPIVDLRHLQYAGNYTIDSMCYLNNALTSINLNALEYIGNEAARTLLYVTTASSSLSEIRFPMLTSFGTNPFYSNAFYGRNNLTIHFRKDMQATVEALPSYSTMWSAGAGSSILFDLAGTLTGLDGNDYARSEISSVYASNTAGAAKTATAWTYNDTTYYTSGNSEPQIGDTIYSDSACTIAVTTINSIA